MENFTLDDVITFANEIGYDVIAIEGEDEFAVLNGEDSVPFSFNQNGFNDAMDILRQVEGQG